jgi:hypothetical protein
MVASRADGRPFRAIADAARAKGHKIRTSTGHSAKRLTSASIPPVQQAALAGVCGVLE